MKHIIITLLLIQMLTAGMAQQIQQIQQVQSKSQLAAMYYRDQEWGKASDLYLELYNTSNMAHYFDYYINCLVNLKEYDKAIKELKKQSKGSKNVNYEITLGFVYKEMGNIQKSEETYNDIINSLSGSSKAVIINIGNSFFNRREFEYAEKTYLKGREVLPGEMFYNNLASVYAYLRNYEKMMKEYLELVIEDDKEVERVQARINSLLIYDFDNSLLTTVKREVLRAMQLKPSIIAYNRLLIWMFVVEKNYEQALLNSIALDRRTKTEESSILDFSKAAAQSDLFDIAIKGLHYLSDRKPEIKNIDIVKQEIVRVEYLKYIHTPSKIRDNGVQLANTFDNYFNEKGFTRENIDLIQIYAHLLSFYMNNAAKAHEIINKGISIAGLNNTERSILRIELADTYVYENKLWEATLLYAQIIEANKENTLGDNVKLKRGKLSFYIGEIEWARGQLDALKASTSKLIANDAMELSLLISANYDLDTIAEPMQQFARADLLLFQNKTEQAFLTYDSIIAKYPIHSLNQNILMRKADISMADNEYQTAASYYETILKKHPTSTLADDALYSLAMLYETKLNDTARAQELYQQMLLNYPGSIFVSDARYRFRVIRGDEVVMPETTPYENGNAGFNW